MEYNPFDEESPEINEKLMSETSNKGKNSIDMSTAQFKLTENEYEESAQEPVVNDSMVTLGDRENKMIVDVPNTEYANIFDHDQAARINTITTVDFPQAEQPKRKLVRVRKESSVTRRAKA